MKDLTTTYLGLTLKNPIVAGSCGLTGSASKIEELAEAGVGAVVLKSLFEEQIEAAFLAVLGRRPRGDEWQVFPSLVTEDQQTHVVDLLWTLMQTTEFQTY